MSKQGEWKAEPIAITGIGCRFPGGANSPSKLWKLLKDPPDLLREIPSSRFNVKGFYHPDGTNLGTTNVMHSYILDEDYSLFDHEFFKIHPREAESMDPQQRILLEVVYEGIESAGYTMANLRGSSTAVFVGQMMDDYYDLVNRDVQSAPQYTATGTCRAIMANRVSYFFDWHGASVSMDTACSSSLVALHQAVQTLRSAESQVAVVAGVNLILGPEKYIYESQLGMLSPTGRSRMWDASADGYARGEAFAALVLKPLSQALADGDRIEAIIRETGVNQDGRSAGLTVPSPSAQTALIESTYRKCGLDCRKKEDRCQYFEAHGTGTLAGDPKEAKAIRDAFFPAGADADDESLLVGSIKTVMGHSEGTAGLAGVIRAVLALKHSSIPPNLHFNKLNPAIEPFFDNLKVPTRLEAWPTVPEGGRRRASVNSFGFGGTNAHAIIETWDTEEQVSNTNTGGIISNDVLTMASNAHYGPFVISARSEGDLDKTTSALCSTLKSGSIPNLGDLAWTLQTRRDQFSFRKAISATGLDELINALDTGTGANSSRPREAIQVSATHPVRILGIFTGQGAQWPRMGARLYLESEYFRQSVRLMQDSLDSLLDAPSWTLADELLAPAPYSRIHLAEISQPLCTAVQIALVDLLRVSGITFSGVVGHSSGEIAAAYAAGHLLLQDAIRIAFYRGLHAKLARHDGSMMAVGMPYNSARDFCASPKFLGRIQVAASNSKSSVTISGDTDAIYEAKADLDDRKVFARKLKVDKAYHSDHMTPCAEAYLESLRQCKVQPQVNRCSRDDDCVWYSSVLGSNGRVLTDLNTIRDTYWIDNLVKPVLFSQSLERAVQEGQHYDLALEVGPHPALKGPTSETLRTLTGVDMPYCGTLNRDQNDMISFSNALGFIWTNINSPTPMPDFKTFAKACNNTYKPKVCPDLPRYSWNHDRSMMKESRLSKNWRTRPSAGHELLGTPISIGGGREVRWRKSMILSEMQWLKGHRFQGQVLFPAAGYISMATEAAQHIAEAQPIRLIELNNMEIHRAITLEPDSNGVDVTFIIKISRENSTSITLEYSCYSADVDATAWNQSEQLNFDGQATLYKGVPTDHELPPRNPPKVPLVDVNIDVFYSWISKIGLDYSGDFLVNSLRRRLGFSTITMSKVNHGSFRLHPATLDASFHGVFGAFCYPEDDRMWTAYLPTRIRRVRIPVRRGVSTTVSKVTQGYVGDCWLRDASDKLICADVDIFSSYDGLPEVQIEGLTCSSFKNPHPDDDRLLFSHTAWRKDISSGIEVNLLSEDTDADAPYHVLERTAYFYMRKLRREIADEEISSMDWHFQSSLAWAFGRLMPRISAGQHSRINLDWEADDHELISAWESEYGSDVTLRLIHAAGKAYPSIARGETPALQVLRAGDLLDRFYKECACMRNSNRLVGHLLGQIAHRHTNMKVLEVGGGTGGTTTTVLQTAARSLESYTFTDISAGFFEKAASKFSKYGDKMVYKTLDISNCPLQQGYEEHSFDIIIAANVLHATKSLEETMKNCNKLLRPGGYLLLLEITGDTLWVQFAFSTLPGWWLGQDEGRIDHPTISKHEWDTLLRRTGFSGAEICYRDSAEESEHTTSVIVSQATNPAVNILRSPLTGSHDLVMAENVVIVSGKTRSSQAQAREAEELLRRFALNISIVNGLEDPNLANVFLGSAVLCLCELEEAAWRHMTEKKFTGIKSIFNNASHIVWATREAYANDPYASMITGLGRSVKQESPHIRIQFVDFTSSSVSSKLSPAFVLSQFLLQQLYRDSPEARDVMWTDETEVMIEGNNLVIPRIIPTVKPNNRLNSGRRIIEQSFSPTDHQIILTKNAEGMVLGELKASRDGVDDLLDMQVDYSSVLTFQASDGPNFWLSVGSVGKSHDRMLAMSPSNSSISQVPSHQLFGCSQVGDSSVLLRRVIATLLCDHLFSRLDGILWLHDADACLVNVASEYAAHCGAELFLSSGSESTEQDHRTVFIHPYTSERVFKSQIPSNVRRLAIFKRDDKSFLLDLIQSVGYAVDVWSTDRLLKFGSVIPLGLDSKKISNVITHTISSHLSSPNSGQPTLLMADEIATAATEPITNDPLSLIMWTGIETIPIKTRAIDPRGLFSSQKTYFLVGLTGELGLSLCEWMVKNGARHLAITSRSPKISPLAIQNLRDSGAQVKVFPLDISDEKALHDVYRHITSTMPPVAGVANAAMVLRDKSFSAMSLDDFEYVLAPKVRGSEYLDKLFHSTDLDFFILFSSLSRVVGNAGQSNYAAANMFMASLVNQRRQRGMVGSVIDIAILVGLGYIHRLNDSSIESQMRRAGYMPLSEPDFHTIFAEAIQAGRPDSSMDPIIHTGLSKCTNAPWSQIPRFSHMAVPEKHVSAGKETEGLELSLQERLVSANDDDDVLLTLENEFCRKIGLMLQIDAKDINKDAPLVSLGIDSLVAVELRSWWLAELKIDVPVLRILGGASLMDICLEIRRGTREILARDSHKKGGDSSINSPDPEQDSPGSSADLSSLRTITRTTSTSQIQELSSSISTRSTTDLPPSIDGDELSATKQQPAQSKIGPMSHSQEALYFLHEYLEDKSSQNVSYYGKFRGPLDKQLFERALWVVSHRHESLRSSYFLDQTTHRPVQAVNDQPQINVVWRDVQDDSAVDTEIASTRSHAFQIERGELMKVVVLSQTPTFHHIILVHHHIVLDATAWLIFLEELDRAYSGQQFDHPVQQAIDIAKVRKERCKPEKLATELEFWGQMHREKIDPLPLFPFCKTRTRHTLTVNDTETVEIPLSNELCSLTRKAAAKIHVTQFHFFLGTLSALLSRCLRIDALNVGIVDANRAEPDTAMAMGSYLNLLPLRLNLDRDESFKDMAQRTRDRVVAGLTHSRVPFEMILDHLQVPRSSDHHPLFQVLVNYRPGLSDETPLGAGKIEWIGGLPSRNSYDLEIDITMLSSQGPGLLSATGQKYMFGQSDLKSVLKWYCRALEEYARNSEISVGRCPIANEEDINQASELGKGVTVNVDWEGTLIHQVERAAEEHPDSPAIKHGQGQTLTYAAVMSCVIQICREIQAECIPAGTNVGMLLNPGASAICCLLAIMRSGLVWVPLDLRNHKHRLSSIASESDLQLIVCSHDTRSMAEQLVVGGTKILCLDGEDREPQQLPLYTPGNGRPENISSLSQDAALLYTSGSTGIPKGVKIGHLALLNQIFVNKQLFAIGREVVLQQTSYGFDIVLDQIFQALANGGVLVVVSQQDRRDPLRLAQLMAEEGITYTHVVPSEYQMMFQYGAEELKMCHSWRIAMAAGEKITHHLRKGFQTLGLDKVRLINAYGPTECTVTCARGEIPYATENDAAAAQNDYLRPLPNYELLILTDDMIPAPIGFPGELCVRGVGVAQGYTNNAEETRRKFLTIGADVAVLYRTGDSARLLEDGTITILGRIEGDSQVKIRGMRVELDDIAATIVRASGGVLVNAAVVWKADLELLAAFVVFDPDFTADKAKFIDRLRNMLPLAPYMYPSYIAPVTHIPSNANGKQDRLTIEGWAIEETDHQEATSSAPELTETQERLLDVWKAVITHRSGSLLHADASVDFFHVGGNSTLLIKLRSIAETTFGVRLVLSDLFQSSTLGSMADLITSASSSSVQDSYKNWASEVKGLCSDLAQPQSSIALPVPEHSVIVLLTGATGFLGKHLLRNLVEDSRVSEVHCVAIRPQSHARRLQVPPVYQAKVFEHLGDLEDAGLGLPENQLQYLRDKVNVIIHNGAQVSFMKTYSTLRRANVLSTKALCDLAIPRRVPLHFISTASVATIANQSRPLPEVSISAHSPQPDSKHGYRDSKWVSESLLEYAQRELGTPVWIHRPTTIVGEGAPDLDLVATIIKYSRVLGSVPLLDSSMVQGKLDLVAVETVAEKTVEAALASRQPYEDGVQLTTPTFVHHCSDGSSFAPDELHLYLEQIDQRPYEVVGLQKWLASAIECGLSKLIYDFMMNSFQDGHQVTLPVLSKAKEEELDRVGSPPSEHRP